MGVIIDTLGWQALAEGLAATGTYETIGAAVEAGAVAIEGAEAVGGFSVITGGAGATVIDFATALDVATAAELTATATQVETASVTLVQTAGGYKLAGLATLSLPQVAAAVAPLAGAALGAGLYQENPALWSRISQTLLPFCYAENKIHAFVEFVQDPLTSEYSPIVCVATAIVDAIRNLFQKEDVHTVPEVKKTDSLNRTVVGRGALPSSLPALGPDSYLESVSGDPTYYGGTYAGTGAGYYFPNRFDAIYKYKDPYAGWMSYGLSGPQTYNYNTEVLGPINPYPIGDVIQIVNDPTISPQYFPPTAGVSAPTIEPETLPWPGFSPDFPIIIIPETPEEPETIPVTPVVPALPPAEPVPLLPEHIPDPTPETPPEEWPEEEPWPTVIPSPFIEPDPSTEPNPNIPYIPWPLPPEKPDEDTPQPDWWPVYPPSWPAEWPEELPWPESPSDWPEEVPWPDTGPDWWPDGEPWPDSPDDWPDDIPWPVPPPWPFPWPDDVPYPWPYPYPYPSPNPYPDPYSLPDPEETVDPYIDPWPWPYPDPNPDPDPDPWQDPSQPDPAPNPDPEPQPVDPDPPPPSGTINPSPPPIIPLPFSSITGLISVYHPTQSELLSFCQWLWVTWQDATIDKIWNNPFDGVITLFELYCTPTDVGRKNIRSGFLDSGVSSETISRYTSIDCGSIGVPEYYGDYLDYAPYSKCHIYLPFIGIVELNVDDVVGHGVNVTYRIDEYNGSCIAMITVAKSTTVNGTEVEYSNIMYQFSGNCAVDLPIAGGSQAAIKAGMLEAAAWGLGSVIGGIMGGSSPLEIGSDLAQGAASAVHSVVSAKSSVQHSGSFGSSFGALGNKKPFIIVTRPKQIQVPNYQILYGYPAHKMVRIGDCTGYLRCREVHVISPQASDEEKAQIEQLLKMGVYVTE